MGSSLLQKRSRPHPEILSPGGHPLSPDRVNLTDLNDSSVQAEVQQLNGLSVRKLKMMLENSTPDAYLAITDAEGNILPVKAAFLDEEDVQGYTVYFPRIEIS